MSDGTKLKRDVSLDYLNQWKGRAEAYTRANNWTAEPLDYEKFLVLFRMNPECVLWRLGPEGSKSHIATLGLDNYWNVIIEERREEDEPEISGVQPRGSKAKKTKARGGSGKGPARKTAEALATVVYPSMRARSAVRAGIQGMDWLEEKFADNIEKDIRPSKMRIFMAVAPTYLLLLLLVVWFGGCTALVAGLFGLG